MGSLYLALDQWFIEDGIAFKLYDGNWKTRARSTGGFDDPAPLCVMWHHTASQTSPQNDCDYMVHGSSDRPISNVLVDRTGLVWLMAGGATNTNGKGRSVTFSKGTVPQDSMNTRAVGMEIANNGVGEAYPQAQIDAAFAVSLCIQRHLGMIAGDCETHADYAPDRKVDPAKAGTTVQGEWHPESINSSGTWSVTDLRAEHQRRWGDPTPPVPDGGDDMPSIEEIKQAVRDVLNEGAPFGTGADPDFPGRPWAEGNANLTATAQDTYNNTATTVAMLDAAKAAIPAVLGAIAGYVVARSHGRG